MLGSIYWAQRIIGNNLGKNVVFCWLINNVMFALKFSFITKQILQRNFCLVENVLVKKYMVLTFILYNYLFCVVIFCLSLIK